MMISFNSFTVTYVDTYMHTYITSRNHKCLNGRAPVYLFNDLQYAGQRRTGPTGMRSASAALH